jgi:hypothetical protein
VLSGWQMLFWELISVRICSSTAILSTKVSPAVVLGFANNYYARRRVW